MIRDPMATIFLCKGMQNEVFLAMGLLLGCWIHEELGVHVEESNNT